MLKRTEDVALNRQQQGAALLIILTVIVLTLTTIVVSSLSINRQFIDRNLESNSRLNAARDALLGYSLRQPIPGTLPCPDNDGDGLEDVVLGGCATARGFLPFRSLGISRMFDKSGGQLWYAVETNYTLGTTTPPKNSASASGLTLDGISVAAVIIATGQPLSGQARPANDFSGFNAANSAVNHVNDYLEGVNADGNPDTFQNNRSDTNNDIVLGIEIGAYWATVEKVVLTEARRLAQEYRLTCGEYPWASSFGSNNSVLNDKAGGFPSGIALPNAWAACVVTPPPAWLGTEWGNMLYYQMCLTAENDCITVNGDNPSITNGVVVAPGIDFSGNRPSVDPADYFESDNVDDTDNIVEYRSPVNHSGAFNDVLQVLSP
ncbi:MAG: hypothetical protein H6998_19040 [Hahellaceae bacterium]|jgi:type II secretory pathway pseudopilin PulG|nr:hypothetical protein [Hahellaceae bacterium]